MAILDDILSRLTALVNWQNAVVTNSKTTDELDQMSPIDRAALLRVALGVTSSKKISIQDLIDDIASEFISGNVPAKFYNLAIDHTTTTPSDIVKMRDAANAGPNYPLQDGALYFLTNKRLVLTNGSYGYPRPGGFYAIVTDFYIVTQKVPPISGVSSIGTGGTPITTGHLKYLFSIDNRSYEPVDIDLGDIGTSEIWEAVNTSGPHSTPNGAVVVFTAIQNAVSESWLYLGNEEEVGLGRPATDTFDFRMFGDGDNNPSYQETLPAGNWSALIPTVQLNNHEGRYLYMNAASSVSSFTTSNHALGGFARILIDTTGKTDYPAVVGGAGATVTLIDSPDFEADELYDMFIECTYIDTTTPANDIINYFFRKR